MRSLACCGVTSTFRAGSSLPHRYPGGGWRKHQNASGERHVMAADGNYVRLHTGTAVHEIRETMSGMTSKLDPEQFARVHRSFIVNRAYVTGVLRKEGAAMAVLLSNGIEIPVGPNYRAEVESYGSYNRLST